MYADRVQETTTTTGTGTITLAGAVPGFRTFTSAFATGERIRYCIALGAEWEVGEGDLATTTTLTRVNVFASSNANALVNFSVGTKVAFATYNADAFNDIGMGIAFARLRVNK